MSAQANIVIIDGATPPVAHIFNPKGAKVQASGKDVALWRDQSVPNSVGYLTITEQHSAKNFNGMEKFRWTIEVPYTETPVGGTAPVKAYACVAVLECWVHERATDTELKNIAAYMASFATTAYVTDAIVKREAAW